MSGLAHGGKDGAARVSCRVFAGASAVVGLGLMVTAGRYRRAQS